MTSTFDIIFSIIIVISIYVGFGIFMGYSMDDNKNKNFIVAFFDGYLIVLPMLGMIAFLAPLIMAGVSLIVVIYSTLKWFIDGVGIDEELTPYIAYFGYCLISYFWMWFRERVLKYESII